MHYESPGWFIFTRESLVTTGKATTGFVDLSIMLDQDIGGTAISVGTDYCYDGFYDLPDGEVEPRQKEMPSPGLPGRAVFPFSRQTMIEAWGVPTDDDDAPIHKMLWWAECLDADQEVAGGALHRGGRGGRASRGPNGEARPQARDQARLADSRPGRDPLLQALHRRPAAALGREGPLLPPLLAACHHRALPARHSDGRREARPRPALPPDRPGHQLRILSPGQTPGLPSSGQTTSRWCSRLSSSIRRRRRSRDAKA